MVVSMPWIFLSFMALTFRRPITGHVRYSTLWESKCVALAVENTRIFWYYCGDTNSKSYLAIDDSYALYSNFPTFRHPGHPPFSEDCCSSLPFFLWSKMQKLRNKRPTEVPICKPQFISNSGRFRRNKRHVPGCLPRFRVTNPIVYFKFVEI